MDKDLFKRGLKAQKHPAVVALSTVKKMMKVRMALSIVSMVIIILLVFYLSKFYWLNHCEKQAPCPTLDCAKCPVKYVEVNVTKEIIVEKKVNDTKYVCKNGMTVKDMDDCETAMPMIEIKHDDQNTYDNVTLAVDHIEWTIKNGNNSNVSFGKVTAVNFTIINKADFSIAPEIAVRVWTEDDDPEVKSLTRDKFSYDTIIEPNSYYRGGFTTDAISFRGKNVTVKLVLVNQLPDPDDTIVMAQKNFMIDDDE